MQNFELLGQLAAKLHGEFQSLYYILLPIFFSLAIVFAWFKHPQGGPDFVEALKRAFIATLLLVGFKEIQDIILLIANGLSDKISDMSGLDTLMKMAGEKAKGYTVSISSLILAFNDLVVAILSFVSYIVLYIARYLMVALYHFAWIFLTLISPFVLLFHLFSPRITLNLFKTMIEVASWQVVWSILSAMLLSLPFGNAYMADGNYLTVIVINFVIAICMVLTPFLVHSLVGSGFSTMATSLGPMAFATMAAAPTKATTVLKMGREVLSDSGGYLKHMGAGLRQPPARPIPRAVAKEALREVTTQEKPPVTKQESPPPIKKEKK